MESETNIVLVEEAEIVDSSEYKSELSQHFNHLPEAAKPLLDEAKNTLSVIKKKLMNAPAFINVIKATVPDVTLQAVLTDGQKKKLVEDAVEIMTKKDGTLLATLRNPKTKKIVEQISLKKVKLAPELNRAMADLSAQMQMAQIAEQIQQVQKAVEEVRIGQENDRLATAYSCQQKLLQATKIKNPKLRQEMLIQIALSAEDSRNLLMLSQKENVKFIMNQPEKFFQKVLSNINTDKINSTMKEIRDSFYVVNGVSLVEAMAYRELGEYEAAKKSLTYYADFLTDTYISVPGLIQRLDMIDPSPDNYWTTSLPIINNKIKELPSTGVELIETKANRRDKQ
ncbi:MAG: hypothetical protein Q4C64_00530 [Erysipelotrichia bacterium]|nr:hypothetical protein [Erysipelotrichia bacterium]